MPARGIIVAVPLEEALAKKGGLTLQQLATYDDIITDALVDRVYYWTTIKKLRPGYHASRGMREEDVTRILQTHVVLNKDPATATQELLRLPGIQRYLRSLATADEKDHFQRHMRKYVNMYLPDCPFEVSTTNRYEITTHEASALARRYIKKGETVKYLSGIQVAMTKEEEEDLDVRNRDFSIVMSSRKKTPSLFLGPARFANHDCNANARLSTTGAHGMQIVAVKDIDVGEEITVTYGDDYFGEDNCECLCATCEAHWRNGWDPNKKAEESDSDESELPDAHEEPVDAVDPEPDHVHPDSDTVSETQSGPRTRTLRSKHRLTFDPETHAPVVVTLDTTPPRSNKRQKTSENGRKIRTAPSIGGLQIVKAEHDTSSLRRATTSDSREESPFAFIPAFIRSGFKRGASTVKHQFTYSKRGRQRNIISDTETPCSNSPASSILDGSSSISTDLTSVDDAVHPVTLKERERFGEAPENRRRAHEQVASAGEVSDGAVDQTMIAGEETPPEAHLREEELESDLSELSESYELDDNRGEIIRRKYKRKILTRQSSRNLKFMPMPIPTIEPSTEYSTEDDGGRPRRRPGDYTLTQRLLPTIYSRWIECQNCDDPFVQHEAFQTRINCPRCERHSKLYGYAWPKTDKDGKHDKEERVLDHRTVHRFVDPEEERTTKKGRRTLSTLIVERVRSSRESESAETPVQESKKRKRRSSS